MHAHLFAEELVDDPICLFLDAIADKRNTHSETPNDLLMLSLVSILKHLIDNFFRARAEHDQTHREPCRLTSYRTIGVQGLFQVIVCIWNDNGEQKVSQSTAC